MMFLRRGLALLFGLLVFLGSCLPAAVWGEEAGILSPADQASLQERNDTRAEGPVPETTSVPARGYVLVTSPTQSGFLPLPEEEDYLFPLVQIFPDGTSTENLLHLTPEGVYMESSTCANQDCVHQGTVTLENRNERVLYNMIICLPNQVTLQLLTPEEVLQMYQQ